MLPLLTAGWDERFAYAAELATQLETNRKAVEAMIELWLGWWHDIMLTKCGLKQSITNVDYILTLEDWAQTLNLLEIKDFIINLQEALDQISKNINPRLVSEVLMLNMPRKEERAELVLNINNA